MKNNMRWKKVVPVSLLFMLSVLHGFAQQADIVEMADSPDARSKIYVVVAVLSIIFAGIAFYLFRLDAKISRMEKERK